MTGWQGRRRIGGRTQIRARSAAPGPIKKVMPDSMVKIAVDLAKLPPLTPAQRTEIDALASPSDREVDTSDIPELSDAFWKSAKRGHPYRPVKKSTTVRIDADVLAWLRGQGKGYQSRINAILRREMLASVK